MTNLFSYWIKPWLLPPGLSFLIIFMGFTICLSYHRTGKIIVSIGIISLWMLSLPIIVYPLINILQDPFTPLTDDSLIASNSIKGILVLGGGSTLKPEYYNTYQVSNFTSSRIDYAVFLHKKTHLPIILSSGMQLPSSQNEAKLMADYLYDKYHLTPLFLEEKSLNTADESKKMAVLLAQNKLKNIYLVTDAWHMSRSAFIFRCAGINITPAPMGYITYGPGYSFISFFPDMHALYYSYYTIHEFIGLAWYHFRYGNDCINSLT
jgi:uncharacterized SAM-binding protein YcdF (DUF218 family)